VWSMQRSAAVRLASPYSAVKLRGSGSKQPTA
jgi:hypothetical protein